MQNHQLTKTGNKNRAQTRVEAAPQDVPVWAYGLVILAALSIFALL